MIELVKSVLWDVRAWLILLLVGKMPGLFNVSITDCTVHVGGGIMLILPKQQEAVLFGPGSPRVLLHRVNVTHNRVGPDA